MIDAKLIEKIHLGLANFLVSPLYLSHQRNKILLSCPWTKLSMLQPGVIVHNFYGCDKSQEL
jgi:hypothetical protein